MGKLHKKVLICVLDKDNAKEYNKLDDSITIAILSAEKKLPRCRDWIWTKELGRLVQQAGTTASCYNKLRD